MVVFSLVGRPGRQFGAIDVVGGSLIALSDRMDHRPCFRGCGALIEIAGVIALLAIRRSN